jgi:DNA-binding transcriptional MerR regulator
MKEPFLSINAVSMQLGVPAHTLRYWERQFPTIVKPATGAGGRRYYRSETIAALEQIKGLLYDNGMTIAGVKKIIKDGGLNREIITKGQPAVKIQTDSSTARTISSPILNLGGAQAETDAAGVEHHADISRAIELLELAKAELN